MPTMTKQNLMLYLTYEFGIQFGLKSLKRIIQYKEVKVWMDDETGYPSFSYGGYHGMRSKDGELLKIGCAEIHLRIDTNQVEDLALLEMSSDAKEFETELIKVKLMSSVYEQIEAQIDMAFESFNSPMIELMMTEKSNEIMETQMFIKKSLQEKVKHVAH